MRAVRQGNVPIHAHSHWKGKKLFVDLDGTLIKADERSGESQPGRGRTSVTLEEYGERITYDISAVNREAAEVIPALRREHAMAFITSVSEKDYAEAILGAAGMRGHFDGIFSWEDFAAGNMACSRKDYRIPISEIGERDPLGNCVAIGNEPAKDISMEPPGMLSVIVRVETSFREVAAVLEILLHLGERNFALGFDRALSEGYRSGGILLINEYDRRPARVIYFDSIT
jgi:hypothetical protein